MIELGLIDLRTEDDVVRAHQTTRTIAAQLGFSSFEQTRIATAISEIARNALVYAGSGSVTVGLDDACVMLTFAVLDRGPGIPNLAAVLAGERSAAPPDAARGPGSGLGIAGARRLMDAFAIESTSAGTRVEMAKRLPRRAGRVDAARVGQIRAQLAGQLADDPTQEIRRLQRDVIERDARIVELTEELTETNRGVMALHAELEARAEYLRAALELRTRIVSELGHELRTPLHSVATISQFLIDRLDGPLTPEQDKQVRIIQQVAESLMSYVNDLLDLARTDAGRATVQVGPVSVDRLLKALRRIMLPLAPRGVALRFSVDRDVPMLETDEQKISQVLHNLVGNALKFTERGHVEVRVRRGGHGDRVIFEVEDTGIGIAPEHRELVFREFAQVDGPLQPRMRGSGLGLPLSRRIAELLGGSLELVATPRPGSTFRFELPVRFGGDALAEQAPAAAPRIEAVPTSSRPRILVIDDDGAARYVLRRWLDGRYQIEEAATGHDGLRLAAARPAAIFLDVVMPDLTGFEVLERLKTAPATRDIPVVVYTALALGANDRERLGAAAAILHKSTSSRLADRAAIEDALVRTGIAIPMETIHA